VFEQQTAIDVPDVGKVFFGAIVTNSEIRDSAFTFEIRYRIVDVKNGNLSFAGIPDLKDSVFSLNHITGIDKIEKKLENMFKLKQLQDTMLRYISELKNSTTISNDSIQLLMHKIIYSRTLKSKTKKTLRVIYDKHIVNNTLSIIQAFNKIDSVVADIDDKVFLERIYHDIIKQIVENKSENV